jgi:hypothetical protein
MGKKEIKEAWEHFLETITSDEINWEDYYDAKTETSFSEALLVIHHAFKDGGIYKE